MKKLIIVRHAKSSWKYDVIDHERPLKKSGINDANFVSKELGSINYQIDLVLCSDATRTKSTANIFISYLKIDQNIVLFKHDLYDFSGENLINVIKNCDDSVENLMIFGHNHAITAFVNTFGTIEVDNVPTSGVVIMEFDIASWSSLNKGKTLKTIFPKDINE